MSCFIAIDFETSGYERYSACSVGMVRIENGVLTGGYQSLIRPPSSYVRFTEIHGLTWNMLRSAPAFPDIWPDMASFMRGADGLVAHNAPFDRSVLAACCQNFRCRQPDLPFYCTLKGAKASLRLPNYRLDSLCSYYHFSLNHHEALSDAKGCARIFVSLLKQGTPLQKMQLKAK